jgi:hypothetical protein
MPLLDDAQMTIQLLPFFLQNWKRSTFGKLRSRESFFLFYMITSLNKQSECNGKICIHLISQYF